MFKIEELQDTWQKQAVSDVADYNTTSKSIIEKIKTTERKIYRINIFKTVGLLIIFSILFYMMKEIEDKSILLYLGTGIIAISTIVFLIIYWKNQFRIKKLNFNLPELKFIDDSIEKIRSQKSFFQRLFLYLIICMILGINIIYFDLLSEYRSSIRLNFHLLYSLLFVGLYFIGLKIREKKFKKELQPLIDDMLELKNELNNNKEE
jgi:F0F1-type ATP synthase assembly protein I